MLAALRPLLAPLATAVPLAALLILTIRLQWLPMPSALQVVLSLSLVAGWAALMAAVGGLVRFDTRR